MQTIAINQHIKKYDYYSRQNCRILSIPHFIENYHAFLHQNKNKFCRIKTAVNPEDITERTVKKLLKFVRCVTAAAAALMFSTAAAATEYVIPSGECVGVKIYTDGLVVVDTTSVTDTNGKQVDIAAGYGICKGDIIKSINGYSVVSNEDLAQRLNDSDGDITLTVSSGGKERDIILTPAATDSGPKLGLWLRDSTAGLGTLTYTKDNTFAALGHGIYDVDTGTIMPIERGIIQNCTITSISKGEKGIPGAITGNIDGTELGKVIKNTDHGLYGELNSTVSGTPIPVASSSEVRTGAAVILADVDGKGVKEYSINIKRVMPPSRGAHDMVIEVTDQPLIEKTGGIVQGMSGAPIIQNGMFAGAVTHVFVNDPLSGYAILAETMLSED